MKNAHPFKNYIAKRFYHALFKAIQDFYQMPLDTFEIKSLDINDEPELRICFDIIVIASYKNVRSSKAVPTQWFTLKCAGDFANELNDFQILAIEPYQKKKRQVMPQPLPESLFTMIKKEDFDVVSEDFLRQYYPEMLEKPQALNPFRLTERLGLSLSMRHLTAKGDIFGQIYFEDAVGQFYSSDKKQTYSLQVKAGDVFIDPESYALRNLGSVNNTIVHECVHWVKHRKAIAFKRLLNENFEELSCQLTTSNHVSKDDAIDWMEWQASQLAPRIMLPKQMFKQKAEEVIRNQREKTGLEELEVLEIVIDVLVEFFGVSRQSAKIRLVDVGFVQAIGTFEYIDGKYIRPYTFKAGTLKKNQTFSIGISDAASLPSLNQDFAKVIAYGRYLYVESHFVLNTPNYLEISSGKLRLTDYARYHMEECCLIFEFQVKTPSISHNYFNDYVLNRDQSTPFEFEIKFHQGYENSNSKKQSAYLDVLMEEYRTVYKTLTNDYCECLENVRSWRETTYKEIADKVLMNERQIRRIFKGESGKIESLVGICLTLQLPPEISDHIISKSPYHLNLADETHYWYHFVLMHYYSRDLGETRKFLLEHDVSL